MTVLADLKVGDHFSYKNEEHVVLCLLPGWSNTRVAKLGSERGSYDLRDQAEVIRVGFSPVGLLQVGDIVCDLVTDWLPETVTVAPTLMEGQRLLTWRTAEQIEPWYSALEAYIRLIAPRRPK